MKFSLLEAMKTIEEYMCTPSSAPLNLLFFIANPPLYEGQWKASPQYSFEQKP
jgi:hypothetical protein